MAVVEPNERTGEYRTAESELVADEDGQSAARADYAIAFVDELESDAVYATGLGY